MSLTQSKGISSCKEGCFLFVSFPSACSSLDLEFKVGWSRLVTSGHWPFCSKGAGLVSHRLPAPSWAAGWWVLAGSHHPAVEPEVSRNLISLGFVSCWPWEPRSHWKVNATALP